MDDATVNSAPVILEGAQKDANLDQDRPQPVPQELPREVASSQDEEPHELSRETQYERLQQSLQEGFDQILQEFQDKLSLDRFKEEQIGKLHNEVQSHRQDLLARATRPLIRGIIRLHDDLERMVGALQAKPSQDLTPERFFRAFDGFADDIELLLGQHGIEPFQMPGDQFDPHRQTALQTVDCGEKEIAGRIARRLRPGFMQGETLLQKERVAVYAFSADAEVSALARHQD